MSVFEQGYPSLNPMINSFKRLTAWMFSIYCTGSRTHIPEINIRILYISANSMYKKLRKKPSGESGARIGLIDEKLQGSFATGPLTTEHLSVLVKAFCTQRGPMYIGKMSSSLEVAKNAYKSHWTQWSRSVTLSVSLFLLCGHWSNSPMNQLLCQ